MAFAVSLRCSVPIRCAKGLLAGSEKASSAMDSSSLGRSRGCGTMSTWPGQTAAKVGVVVTRTGDGNVHLSSQVGAASPLQCSVLRQCRHRGLLQ